MLRGFISILFEHVLFLSSMLTSEKRVVSFSELLHIGSILRWCLHLKTALRVRSFTFSVTESNSLYLETFRFFTVFEKKLFRVSTTQLLKFHPFYYTDSLLCMKVNVSLISKIVCYQLRSLCLSFHSILS